MSDRTNRIILDPNTVWFEVVKPGASLLRRIANGPYSHRYKTHKLPVGSHVTFDGHEQVGTIRIRCAIDHDSGLRGTFEPNCYGAPDMSFLQSE